MNNQQDDSFFGPTAGAGGGGDSQRRARALFGLPGDPTARHGIPTQFDDDYEYDESFSYHHQRMERMEPVESLGLANDGEAEESMEYADEVHQQASQIEPSSDAYAGYDTTNPDDSQHVEHQGDTTYPETEGSSIDPDEDPEAWAERLDEIAGMLEMSEAEVRALTWGPAIGSQRDNHHIQTTDFRRVIDHHLEATEWRFTGRADLGRGTEYNPNRVLGRAYIGHQAGERLDPLAALRETLIDSGHGTVGI